MKLLRIDIETSPIRADVWGLWNQNVGLSQINEPSRMICFAAWWDGTPKRACEFHAEWTPGTHGHDGMVERAWELLDEADVVEHYNGERFDVPILNTEFLTGGLKPPAPYRQIDLLRVVKKRFRFPSNKLQYVNTALGYPGKMQHEGHELWVKVLRGDERAQRTMERYNKRDVIALGELHDKLLPWIPGLPSVALMEDQKYGCLCGSTDLERRGFAYTNQSKFQRYRCRSCGRWMQDTRRVLGSTLRAVAA